ncbi:DEAD/DEAH box helicase [Kordiimonas sp. SCSIO 12610]|uniref:DEAD/DEAH box helicase n=1 Tax=Kordiimonas sp. SCSIO 12610 TaxID=2829597 RepID=UPI00210B6A38|nr:DEAD/DEAH box helicase [Kordiimonas sp. SCSIO 12610]UTW55409.1 DEAD/DEAH box helicase [Kordiimonas sp. SCSIO 12610]
MAEFEQLGLGKPLLSAVNALDYEKPTAIQAAAIPHLLSGLDLIGIAQTGGGKSAAFILPLLEKLSYYEDRPKPGMPRALILAPTRELAQQISTNVRDLSLGQKARQCVIFGGTPYKTQTHILQRGVDIVIATPGRLIDHLKKGNVYLDETEYFVLDEADRMLDMGFIDDVRSIARKLRQDHQSVMFSATFSDAIRELSSTILNDPEFVEVARQATIADNLTHKILYTPREKKNELLLYLIAKEKAERALVFTRTKAQADALADYLQSMDLNARSIHGDKPQRMRDRIIRQFRNDQINFLVATDVAARGIDVPDITHVFNTDVPLDAENYVHRIGRTARGGASGKAFTLCDKAEFKLVRAIENIIKQAIETETDHPFPLEIKKFKPKSRKSNTGTSNASKSKPGKKLTQGKKKSLAKKAKKAAGRADIPKQKTTKRKETSTVTSRKQKSRTGTKRPQSAKSGGNSPMRRKPK